mgnify:CR=1 FL=1
MILPLEVQDTVRRFAERFPVPHGQPGPEHEDRVRTWMVWLVQQVVHDFPNGGWGSKRASLGRPLSKDAIARVQFQPSRLMSWDLLVGAGTGAPQIATDPLGEDVTGQIFEPVQPVNHLGGVKPDPVSPDNTVLDRLDRLDAAVRGMADAIAMLADKPDPEYAGETVIPFPAWAGGSRSVTVVLKPRR